MIQETFFNRKFKRQKTALRAERSLVYTYLKTISGAYVFNAVMPISLLIDKLKGNSHNIKCIRKEKKKLHSKIHVRCRKITRVLISRFNKRFSFIF